MSGNSDKAARGFSLAGSLIGGQQHNHNNGGNSGRNKKDASARLREGLSTMSSTSSVSLSISKSPVSSPDRSYAKQQRSSQRRVASYRQNNSPQQHSPGSPQRHKRSVSQDILSAGGIKFPNISLSPSTTDTPNKQSNRSNTRDYSTANSSHTKREDYNSTPHSSPSNGTTPMNKDFEEHQSVAMPSYKNTFTVSSGSNNAKSPSSSQTKMQRAATAAAAGNNTSKSPKSAAVTQTTIEISSPLKQQQLKKSTKTSPLFVNNKRVVSASPPNTPPESPSPTKTNQHRVSRASSPSPNKMKSKSTRSRSPSPARVLNPTTTTRTASPMRAPSPLQSIKSKLAQKSGKHSTAVGKVLGDDDSNAAASGSSGSNSSPTKTISSYGSPQRKSRFRTRSPSPLRLIRPSGSKDTLDNRSYKNLDADDEETTSKGTSSFSLGKTSIRSMSPGRLKKNIKSKLTSASPKRERPPPPQPKVPLHPTGSEDVRSKHSFDDGLDQIALTLERTTMSFDVIDDDPAAAAAAEEERDEEESVDMNVDEPDIEDGCIINTTSSTLFHRREFVRAMGGVNEALSARKYIQQGDAFCEQGGEYLDRALQMYYAGLGTILSRIREWTIEQQEDQDASVVDGEKDVPLLPPAIPSNLSYRDFVSAACCADVNVLLLAISTILFRLGNTHFRLQHFETACRDYSSAQSYQSIRTKALSSHAMNESFVMEDAKLSGRVRNNMASALSKRQLYEEARAEYTKALQIKQSTLETLHKTLRQKGDSAKDTDDKNLVSDIASTFHNIGLLRLNCDEAAKAEKAFKQSLSLRVKKFGLDDLRVSSTLNALGGLYYKTKRYEDAFRSYKESLRIWKLNGSKSDLQTAEHYYNIGLVFYAKGPYSKAKVSVAECTKIRRQLCGNVSLPVAEALALFGKVSLSLGNVEDAFDKFQEALAIRQKLLSKDHLLVSNVHLLMGKVHLEMEECDKAMSSFSVALAVRSDRLGKHHLSTAEVLHAIGSAYIEVEEYRKAFETLQEALRLQRRVLGPSLEAAETLNTMSLVFFKSGDTEKAIELGEEALLMLKSSVGFDHILVAHVLKNNGDYYQDVEAYDDAMEAYGESLRIMAAWLGREHVLLSKTLSEVGVVRFKTGEYTIAKQSFTEALRIMRLPGNGDDNSSIYPTLSHLGHALYKNKELKLASESYLESFNIQASIVIGEENRDLEGFSNKMSCIEDEILALEQSSEDTSELSSALGGIANILRYIGLVNQEQGEFEQALYVNKLSLSVRMLQPFKEYSAIALMAETIAMFEFKLKNFEQALDYFNQALEAKKELQDDVTIDVARTVNNLANIHFSLGNLDEAMELYQEALEIKKSCLGEDSDDVVNTLKNIAQVMVTAGKEQDALQAYQSIVKIRRERYGENHISVAETLASIGDVYIKLAELEEAMSYFEHSIKIQKTQDGPCDERVLENLGSIYGKLGNWQKAESVFREIVQIKRSEHGDDYLAVARTLDLLAVSYIEQERSSESIEHLQEALRIRKACLASDDDEILASLNKLAFVYKSLDMIEEIEQVKAEFEAIQNG